MKRVSLIFTSLFLFLFGVNQAQTVVRPQASVAHVRGNVTDQNGQGASLAVLKLLTASDSTFISGYIADENGLFAIPISAPGTYIIRVSYVGRNDVTSPTFSVSNGDSIKLASIQFVDNSTMLNTVVVKARQQYVDQQVDKTVINVQADVTAAGKNAFEVLQQAPGVVIDPNDNIQMAGKQGVNVYIDGRAVNLSPTDLANLLKSTPGANLEKVELITNPSSRYDAQGQAGVINIRFKKNKSLGMNGTVTAGYAQSQHSRQNGAIDLNYRFSKVNVYGNAGWNGGYQHTKLNVTRIVRQGNITQQFDQNGFDDDRWSRYMIKTGADYYINTKSTLGLLVLGSVNRLNFGTTSTTRIGDLAGRLDSMAVNNTINPSHADRLNTVLNYRFADTLGTEFILTADYTNFFNDGVTTLNSDFFNAQRQPIGSRGNQFNATTNIHVFSLKGDLTKEWKKVNTKLEAGFKTNFARTDNDFQAFMREDNQFFSDSGRTNTFKYVENVHALYANLTKKINKWTVQGGLRGEYAQVQGISMDLARRTRSTPDTSYLNIFPTAFIQYQASDNNQFNVNYSRRIQRPNYQDLNPFVYQSDPFTVDKGNPYLRPQYTHNLEFAYTYRWAHTIRLGYSHTNDYYTDVTHQNGTVTTRTIENVGQADLLNLSLSSPFKVTKWWNGYAQIAGTWNLFRTVLPEGSANVTAMSMNAYMQHNINLPKEMTLQVSGWYSSPRREAVFYNRGLGGLNLGLQRKVMKQNGTLQLGIDDILNTMRWAQRVDFGNVQFESNRKWESRRFKIQFTYRFGNQQIKKGREWATDDNKNRIKEKNAN